MAYQYINPQVLYGNMGAYPTYAQNSYGFNQANTFNQNQFVQNPYQASFYDSSIAYPYMPMNYNVYGFSQNPYMTNMFGFDTNIQKTNAPYTEIQQIRTDDGKTLHIYQLQNGQKVGILPVKDEATIVKTYVDAGSMNEKDNVRGISHVIEHDLFKGSSKLQDGDVFKLTGLMGASTNASTDFEQTDYYITAPYMDSKNLAKTIEIQGDMVYRPKFTPEAVESEKNPICSEISMMNDEATTVAYDSVIRNLFQIKSTSENLVAGSIKTVSDLTREQIVDHHQTYYTPDNLYTVVVGDVDPSETIDLISKNFTGGTNSKYNQKPQYKEPLNPIQKPIRQDIRSSKTNYTTAIMAFAGPKPDSAKDFVIYDMINWYLSRISTSDLKNELEDINACYSSSLQRVGLDDNDPYALISVMALNPKDEGKALDSFYDAVQKLQTKPLTKDEMSALKKSIKKAYNIANSNSEALCDMIGNGFLDNSFGLFSNYQTILDSITEADIMNFCRKYYDLNKISIMVVHPANVTEDEIKDTYNTSKYSLRNTQMNPKKQVAFCGSMKVDTDEVQECVLSNNTHLALNKTNQDLCVFNWCVNTPPVKPKNPNIPAVLSYMFLKGSEYKNQDELERFKELNAIDAEVYVNGKSIEIVANCMPESTEKTLKLMNELMYSPKLTQNDFETAKRYVKDQLIASQKDAESNLLDNVYPGYFPTKAQMLRQIDDLTLDDVKEFYQKLLMSASSSLVATIPDSQYQSLRTQIINSQSEGDIKFKTSVPKLTPVFEANPRKNVVYDTDDLNQAQISKAYKFPLSGNIKDEAKFEMVNMILGATPNARLFSDLRDKQNLAYSVSSSIQSFENTGILTLKIQTTTDNKQAGVQSFDNVQKSLDGFKKHTDALCNELVSDEELEAAKTRMKQRLIGQCQNPLTKTDLLAMNVLEPYGIKRISKYLEAIDSVTKEDIRNAARFIFSYNPTISILASPDTINSQMEYLKTQGEVQHAS